MRPFPHYIGLTKSGSNLVMMIFWGNWDLQAQAVHQILWFLVAWCVPHLVPGYMCADLVLLLEDFHGQCRPQMK